MIEGEVPVFMFVLFSFFVILIKLKELWVNLRLNYTYGEIYVFSSSLFVVYKFN